MGVPVTPSTWFVPVWIDYRSRAQNMMNGVPGLLVTSRDMLFNCGTYPPSTFRLIGGGAHREQHPGNQEAWEVVALEGIRGRLGCPGWVVRASSSRRKSAQQGSN